MQLVNLTPHEVKIYDQFDKLIRTIGTVRMPSARVASKQIAQEPIDGVPFSLTIFGEPENLPDPEPGTVFIVSQLLIAACPDRTDLVRPDTGPDCVRDSNGRILGVRRLTR